MCTCDCHTSLKIHLKTIKSATPANQQIDCSEASAKPAVEIPIAYGNDFLSRPVRMHGSSAPLLLPLRI
jgi:hypothetical protein